MKKRNVIGYLLMGIGVLAPQAHATEDPKTILEKSADACRMLPGGSYRMTTSKKLYYDKSPAAATADCKFLRVEGDSAAPFKFDVRLNNGDGTLCMSNDLVQLIGADSTGIIYSRNTNQGTYRGAYQSEGLFPPFFQSGNIFSLDRMEQTTFIVRMTGEEKVMGKSCYKIQLIDLIRAAQADQQRQEKLFLIDKESYLPVSYEEKTVTKLNTDSLVKESKYTLTELRLTLPHDSVFTYKSIPGWYRLRNILDRVYHHHLKTGLKAPEIRGKLTGGDSLRTAYFAGRKTLICFISRTSYPSLKSLTAIQELQDRNPSERILIAGIDVAEADLIALLKKKNITVPSVADAQEIADAFYITAAPAFVWIDEKGIVLKMSTGFRDEGGNALKD